MIHYGLWHTKENRWICAHDIIFSTTSLAVAEAQLERFGSPSHIAVKSFGPPRMPTVAEFKRQMRDAGYGHLLIEEER